MKKGDYVQTPRFCGVRISEVFDSVTEAHAAGYTEPTHYERGDGWTILGKSLDLYRMSFAAARLEGRR